MNFTLSLAHEANGNLSLSLSHDLVAYHLEKCCSDSFWDRQVLTRCAAIAHLATSILDLSREIARCISLPIVAVALVPIEIGRRLVCEISEDEGVSIQMLLECEAILLCRSALLVVNVVISPIIGFLSPDYYLRVQQVFGYYSKSQGLTQLTVAQRNLAQDWPVGRLARESSINRYNEQTLRMFGACT